MSDNKIQELSLDNSINASREIISKSSYKELSMTPFLSRLTAQLETSDDDFLCDKECEEHKKEQIEKRICPTLDISESKDWIIGQKFKKFRDNIFNFTNTHSYQGPTPESNWLIKKEPGSKKGSLAIGGYPDRFGYLKNLLGAGLKTFVCLNDEYGKIHQKGKICVAYAENNAHIPKERFIHIPIKDMDITDDKILDTSTNDIVDRILNGEDVYLHCSGGHGRSGTFAAVILRKMFPKLTTNEIFNYIQWAHDQRVANYFGPLLFTQSMLSDPDSIHMCVGQVPTPQHLKQRNQVKRLFGEPEIK
jgi:hypothetical protein